MAEETTNNQETSGPAAENQRAAQPQASYWQRAKAYVGKSPTWLNTSLACLVSTTAALYINNNWSFQRLSNINVKSVEVRDVNGDGKMDAVVNRYIGSNSTYFGSGDGTATLEGRTK